MFYSSHGYQGLAVQRVRMLQCQGGILHVNVNKLWNTLYKLLLLLFSTQTWCVFNVVTVIKQFQEILACLIWLQRNGIDGVEITQPASFQKSAVSGI